MQELLFMRGTTSGGRKPTFDERKNTSLGLILLREMESPPDLDWELYKSKLSQLDYYYQLWQTDAGLQKLEQTGCPGSPSWDDLSDEPDTP
jgi:hypothetical protein